jgi:hypothetical protein
MVKLFRVNNDMVVDSTEPTKNHQRSPIIAMDLADFLAHLVNAGVSGFRQHVYRGLLKVPVKRLDHGKCERGITEPSRTNNEYTARVMDRDRGARRAFTNRQAMIQATNMRPDAATKPCPHGLVSLFN